MNEKDCHKQTIDFESCLLIQNQARKMFKIRQYKYLHEFREGYKNQNKYKDDSNFFNNNL